LDLVDVLVRFGTTGRVGLLQRGADLRDLVAGYGMPWDIGRIGKRRRWPHLYSYGDAEFVVCICRIVTSISVQTWRGSVELPGDEGGGLQRAPACVTYRQMIDALERVGCAWEALPPIQGQCGLRTVPEKIEFVFTLDEGSEPVLHGAHSWAYSHECIDPGTAAREFPDGFPREGSA